MNRLRFAAPLLVSLLVACSSSSSKGDSGPGGAAGSGGATSTSTGSGDPDAGPAVPPACVSPPSAAPTKITRTEDLSLLPLTLPVTVTGSSTKDIEFQYFAFSLTDVANVDLVAAVADFTDGTEKTGMGIKIRNNTVDVNKDVVSVHLDPSTPSSKKDVSTWLFPGDYVVILSRATYASANTMTPTLPHAYTFTIGITLPPVVTASCTPPKDSLSTTDVTLSAECNMWCKRPAACKTSCAADACAVEVGQCAASTRKYLECIATTGKVTCIDVGAGPGYGLEDSCSYDVSVCEPGTIREP